LNIPHFLFICLIISAQLFRSRTDTKNGADLPFSTTGLPQPLNTNGEVCAVMGRSSLYLEMLFYPVRGGSSLWKVEQIKRCALVLKHGCKSIKIILINK